MKTRYKKYKSSGMDLVDLIPVHWNYIPLKHLCYMKGRIGWKGLKQEEFLDDREFPYLITGQDIQNDEIDWNKCYHVSEERYLESPEIMVQEGDLLFTKDGTIGKILFIDKLPGKTSLNSHLLLIRPLNERYISKFLYYIFKSQYFLGYVDLTKTGTTFYGVSQETMMSFKGFFPPLHEQKEIVRYLDERTSQIDNLISITNKKIELLKINKTSLINTVITKGLNPNVELKRSGVEWIGEIPKHWERTSVKRLVSTKLTDGPHTTPNFIDSGTPFISVESIKDDKIDFDFIRGYISKEDDIEFSKKTKPQKDDILLVKSGSTTGKVTIVETDIDFNIWSPLCLIRTKKEKILPRFVFLSMKSEFFQLSVQQSWSFGTQPNIGMGVIENLFLVVPPIEEQKEIVKYIDTKTKEIDTLVSIEQRRIETLKEYRKSLISEVVTGKVSVCE